MVKCSSQSNKQVFSLSFDTNVQMRLILQITSHAQCFNAKNALSEISVVSNSESCFRGASLLSPLYSTLVLGYHTHKHFRPSELEQIS